MRVATRDGRPTGHHAKDDSDWRNTTTYTSKRSNNLSLSEKFQSTRSSISSVLKGDLPVPK